MAGKHQPGGKRAESNLYAVSIVVQRRVMVPVFALTADEAESWVRDHVQEVCAHDGALDGVTPDMCVGWESQTVLTVAQARDAGFTDDPYCWGALPNGENEMPVGRARYWPHLNAIRPSNAASETDWDAYFDKERDCEASFRDATRRG